MSEERRFAGDMMLFAAYVEERAQELGDPELAQQAKNARRYAKHERQRLDEVEVVEPPPGVPLAAEYGQLVAFGQVDDRHGESAPRPSALEGAARAAQLARIMRSYREFTSRGPTS